MQSGESYTYLIHEVRRQDHDRYLTALFAARETRMASLALYAFSAELAHVRETVSEPMLGEIRLQWWRDTIAAMVAEGTAPRHPVAEALAAEMKAGRLDSERLSALVDARIPEIYDEVPESMAVLEERLGRTAGDLAVAVLDVSVTNAASWRQAARSAGVAWGLVSVLRSVPVHAAGNRLFLPRDRMDAHGLRIQDLVGPDMSRSIRTLLEEVAERARSHIEAARGAGWPPRRALHVFLQATLAESYLKTLERADFNIYRNVGERGAAGRLSRLFLAAMRRRF